MPKEGIKHHKTDICRHRSSTKNVILRQVNKEDICFDVVSLLQCVITITFQTECYYNDIPSCFLNARTVLL